MSGTIRKNGLLPQPPSARDLSERFTGMLTITIHGVGTQKKFFNGDSLATHVAEVHRSLHPRSNFVIGDIRNTPWEIVFFDREAKKLVVRPV